MQKSISIDPRYCGPPTSGQGGYVSGLLASALDTEICEVSLKSPIPLTQNLILSSNADQCSLFHDDKLLVSAKAGTVNLDIPSCPNEADVIAASALYRGHSEEAVFTTCFVCGKDRHDQDAMRIFAGPVESPETQGLHAAHWIPDTSHKGDDSAVAPEFIWSALDCPGYFAGCTEGQFALLGRITAHITGQLKVGEKATVIAWPIKTEGRKALVGTALFNQSGECIAVAEGLWIHINSNLFG